MSVRYWVQVSPHTLWPSPRARWITAGTLGGADVEDHQRLVDQRGTGDRPADRLDLAEAGMRRHVIARRTVAALEQPAAHPGDHAVVLGMHADHQAVPPGRVEHVEELHVLDAAADRR